LFLGLLGKFVEVEHDVDLGQESLIKCLDVVSSEEHDSLIILKMSKAVIA